jgi:diguanylate cyclase (GGDEF)-like protein
LSGIDGLIGTIVTRDAGIIAREWSEHLSTDAGGTYATRAPEEVQALCWSCLEILRQALVETDGRDLQPAARTLGQLFMRAAVPLTDAQRALLSFEEILYPRLARLSRPEGDALFAALVRPLHRLVCALGDGYSTGAGVSNNAYLTALEARTRLLEDLAIRDPRTRLCNCWFFERRLDQEVTRARRQGRALCLLMIDVDHFKQINDRWGHLTGDRILVFIAGRIRRSVRKADLTARYGGDEFAVLLVGTAGSGGKRAAERIREVIARESVDRLGLPITVSIGVAEFPAVAATGRDLREQADRALYAAKRRGRDQVVLAFGVTAGYPSPEGTSGDGTPLAV